MQVTYSLGRKDKYTESFQNHMICDEVETVEEIV